MVSGTVQKRGSFVYFSDGPARLAELDRTHPPIRVGWRVVAANNRSLGRSYDVFPSLEECRTAALTLHRRIEQVIAFPFLSGRSGHWNWAAQLDSTQVAVCMRSFPRRVDCARALRLFVEAVGANDPSVAELRYVGSLSLRAYDRVEGVSP